MAFGYTTLSIPIREGDTKFPYAMKLVPPKDLERIDHLGTWYYLLTLLTLGMKISALYTIHRQTHGMH